MRKSLYSDEQIVAMVRESHEHGVPATSTKHKVSQHSICLWRRTFGTIDAPYVSELKRIMQENARLKKLVDERDLELEIMKEINAQKW
ncbi:MAG: transposase [Ignavibacteria bacterium]|nr:transposase [Ignavibacteria bacterium]